MVKNFFKIGYWAKARKDEETFLSTPFKAWQLILKAVAIHSNHSLIQKTKKI
jgi:hypothetical protein